MLFFAVGLIIYYSDLPLLLPEQHFGFLICDPQADKLWYNLGISYVSAYLFYIIQVYIPAFISHKRAFKSIRKELSEVLRSTKRTLYELESLYKITDTGDMLIIAQTVYYNTYYWDSYCQAHDNPLQSNYFNGLYKRTGKTKVSANHEFDEHLRRRAKQYRELTEKRALERIDERVDNLISSLRVEALYDEIINARPIAENKSELLQLLATAMNASNIRDALALQLEQLGGCGDDVSVKIDDDGEVFIEMKNGKRINTPRVTQDLSNLPFFTQVADSLKNVKRTLEIFDYNVDVDSDITFEQMTEEEIKKFEQSKKLSVEEQRGVNQFWGNR